MNDDSREFSTERAVSVRFQKRKEKTRNENHLSPENVIQVSSLFANRFVIVIVQMKAVELGAG